MRRWLWLVPILVVVILGGLAMARDLPQVKARAAAREAARRAEREEASAPTQAQRQAAAKMRRTPAQQKRVTERIWARRNGFAPRPASEAEKVPETKVASRSPKISSHR